MRCGFRKACGVAAHSAGLLLTPGASGGRDHPALVAVEDAVAADDELAGFGVLRHEFAYQRPVIGNVVDELMADYAGLTEGLVGGAAEDRRRRMVLGGRSFGGRACSMAVAEGLPAAGLVLLSYPLHPPGKPEKLRVDHFGDIKVPCLFVSGDNDPFGTPAEFAKHLPKIGGEVSTVFVSGGGHNPASAARLEQIASAVTGWLRSLGL